MGAMPLQHEIHYPDSDGQPMAESTVHWNVMVDTAQVLARRYAETPDVWVGSNLLLYYVEGRPELSVAPDVLVVRGVAKWDRPIFKLWEEGHPPCFVLEATSNSSRRQDPGFRLTAQGYEPIPRLADGSLPSQTTGLLLRGDGIRLRLVDAATGDPLPWTDEIEAALKTEEAARQAAEAALKAAEERSRALEEELARLRGELRGQLGRDRQDG
jgi:hypothetical protein